MPASLAAIAAEPGMKLRRPLPPHRSLEQVYNHYLVEKAIADRLRMADREERRRIFTTMYDEVFGRVPDHPRLAQREDAQSTLKANLRKFATLRGCLNASTVFAEFAPGDCKFAHAVAARVQRACGVDISDQRNPHDPAPNNFRLILFDGYTLPGIEANSIDVAFSYQLVEHLHPEDTRLHFEHVYHVLKPGGMYVFDTPHAYSGPHDVSQYFSDTPQGFHLKEWTYIELNRLLEDLKYSEIRRHWFARGMRIAMPKLYFEMCERMLGRLPARFRRRVSRYAVPSIMCVLVK